MCNGGGVLAAMLSDPPLLPPQEGIRTGRRFLAQFFQPLITFLPANGVTDRHILYNTINGKITQAAFDKNTLANCGEACSPQTSSNKIMLTLVSITEAHIMLPKRIQLLPFQ